MDNKWQAGNGTRQCAIHAMVEVEMHPGQLQYAPGPRRADSVAWTHVARWRLGAAEQGWIDWDANTLLVVPPMGKLVEIMTAHGDVETGAAHSFDWTIQGADTIVRYRVVAPALGSPEHHAAYVHQAVAEHDRLSAIIEAKDVALRAAEVRSSELEFERDQARASLDALAEGDREELRSSRDACAILECENATLRNFGERMQHRSIELSTLHHNLNIAALRDCLPLDFDEQLLEWVK